MEIQNRLQGNGVLKIHLAETQTNFLIVIERTLLLVEIPKRKERSDYDSSKLIPVVSDNTRVSGKPHFIKQGNIIVLVGAQLTCNLVCGKKKLRLPIQTKIMNNSAVIQVNG